jgi:hypothetical protein
MFDIYISYVILMTLVRSKKSTAGFSSRERRCNEL